MPWLLLPGRIGSSTIEFSMSLIHGKIFRSFACPAFEHVGCVLVLSSQSAQNIPGLNLSGWNMYSSIPSCHALCRSVGAPENLPPSQPYVAAPPCCL